MLSSKRRMGVVGNQDNHLLVIDGIVSKDWVKSNYEEQKKEM